MLQKIKDQYRHYRAKPMTAYKESAVMILLQQSGAHLSIIFEVRALGLKTQPGDICLPGGKIEEGETSKEAGLREVIEELNLKDRDIEYVGEMDYLENPYGIRIYPHIGLVKVDEIDPNQDEVDHIFKVPLAYFMDNQPESYNIKVGPIDFENFPFDKIRGGKDYPFRVGTNIKYFYQYNEYVIWGFTAEIIKHFVDSLE